MIKIKINKFEELDEGRIDDAKKKYPGQDELIDKFSTAPGNNKYLFWMMDHSEGTDPDEMLAAIQKFDKYQKSAELEKKDINQYSSFEELQYVTFSLKPPKKELEKSGTHSLYDDEKVSLVRPLNQAASCKLGSNTKWCVSATKGPNYFSDYSSANVKLYFILNKESTNDKYNKIAYAINNDYDSEDDEYLQIFDTADDQIDRHDVARLIGSGLEEKLFNIMLNDVKSGPKSDDSKEENYNIDIDEIKNLVNSGKEFYSSQINDISKEFIERLIDWNNEYTREIKDTDKLSGEDAKIKLNKINNDYKDIINAQFSPSFIEMLKLNNPKVNEFLNRLFTDYKVLKLLPNFIKNKLTVIDPEMEKKLKIKELVNAIYDNQKIKKFVETLYSSGNESIIPENLKTFFFPTYQISEIKEAVDIVLDKLDREEKINENKKIKFYKNGKHFKLLR